MNLKAKTTKVDYDFISDGLIPIHEFISKEIFSNIKYPTLTSYLMDDQLIRPWFAKFISADVADAENLIFKNGGYMLLQTCTHELTSKIVKLINELKS